jgi:polysaccharide pyruvyl transferase CsaB
MKKNILLLGAYGQNNLGDELLLYSFLNYIDTKGYNVICNSTNPEETGKKFGIKSFHTSDIKSLLKYLFKSKYVVFGGGSQFKTLPAVFQRRKESVLINILIVTIAARLLFKKTYFISVGAGPLDTKFSRFLTKIIIVFSNKILLRDESSFELMKSVSNSKKLVSSGDGLYLSKNLIDEIIDTQSKKSVEKSVVISPNLHTKEENLAEVEIKALSEVANQLAKNGYKINLIPFQKGFTHVDDFVACERILENIEDKSKAEIVELKDEKDIFALMQKQKIIIGVRLHSIIIGSLCRVPVIAVCYDPKVAGYMKDMRLSKYAFDLNKDLNSKNILNAVNQIENDYETARKEVKDGIDSIATKINESLIEVKIK